MGKRNKIRYQSTPKEKILIILTGTLYLQYRDDEQSLHAKKGDLLVYPQNEALHTTRQGEYEVTGLSGYFKIDVCDGKEWRAVLLNDIFLHDENHFSKTERPIDTYEACAELLQSLKGRALKRTYREHYELEE